MGELCMVLGRQSPYMSVCLSLCGVIGYLVTVLLQNFSWFCQ